MEEVEMTLGILRLHDKVGINPNPASCVEFILLVRSGFVEDSVVLE